MDGQEQIEAVKISLDLMLQENIRLLEHFQGALEQLNALQHLPGAEKQRRFAKLEAAGLFRFQGADVRYFSEPTRKSVSSEQFIRRTRRRLQNTVEMIGVFEKHHRFAEGEMLCAEITGLIRSSKQVQTNRDAHTFRTRVQALRDGFAFQCYLDAKRRFIQQTPTLRAEMDIIAVKGDMEEKTELLQDQAVQLDALDQDLQNGQISASAAQRKLNALSLADDAAQRPTSREDVWLP